MLDSCAAVCLTLSAFVFVWFVFSKGQSERGGGDREMASKTARPRGGTRSWTGRLAAENSQGMWRFLPSYKINNCTIRI